MEIDTEPFFKLPPEDILPNRYPATPVKNTEG